MLQNTSQQQSQQLNCSNDKNDAYDDVKTFAINYDTKKRKKNSTVESAESVEYFPAEKLEKSEEFDVDDSKKSNKFKKQKSNCMKESKDLKKSSSAPPLDNLPNQQQQNQTGIEQNQTTPTYLQSTYQENRNTNPNVVFKKYHLIKDAVVVSDKSGNLPIFSLDKANPKTPGAKCFYTASYDLFWQYYSGLNPNERCFYETLLPNQLCHLYGDIEGLKGKNKTVDFEDLYSNLMKELESFLKSHLKLQKETGIRIVDLDSTTAKKFSKHCIFKIDGCYFRNNYHCGAFMRRFQKYILEKYGHPAGGRNPFFIWSDKETDFKDHSNKVFFVDLGVYTLRRQFRLIGSSKRSVPRRPLYLGDKRTLTKPDFFDCLIQYVPTDTSIIKTVFHITEPDGSSPTSCSLRTFNDQGLPISIAINQMPRQQIAKTKQEITVCCGSKNSLPWQTQQVLKEYFKNVYGYTIESYTVNGSKIKFETYDTRCLNKKKMTGVTHHKSNHVYFVVFADTKQHFQGCYDDDTCNNKITRLGDNGRITDAVVIDELNKWWNPTGLSACNWSVI